MAFVLVLAKAAAATWSCASLLATSSAFVTVVKSVGRRVVVAATGKSPASAAGDRLSFVRGTSTAARTSAAPTTAASTHRRRGCCRASCCCGCADAAVGPDALVAVIGPMGICGGVIGQVEWCEIVTGADRVDLARAGS